MVDVFDITVSYPGRAGAPVISSLDLSLTKGDYLSILGPNGCGKSTLIKAICGLVSIQSGKIRIGDKVVRPGRFGEDLFGTVAAVFQEPGGQFLMPDVEAELTAVLQNLGLETARQNEILEKIVGRFALGDVLSRKPEFLSGGQTQLVNLACALEVSPDLLLLDEPTTFLDSGYRSLLLDLLDELNGEGLTVIHVTQYPAEAARARKVAVMESGGITALGAPESIFNDDRLLARCRLLPPPQFAFRKTFGFSPSDSNAVDRFCSRISTANRLSEGEIGGTSEGEVILKAENLGYSYPDNGFFIDVAEFGLRRGSVTAVMGPAGSGKSTLAFLLAGLLSQRGGDIVLEGRPISQLTRKALRKKIGISWQMPENVLIGPTAADDLRLIFTNLELPEGDVEKSLSSVSLSGFENRIVDSLSGGEKRKVALAGTLACDPEIVILDEPAAFLDPYSQSELAEIIRGLAGAGKAVLAIGHDLPFLSEVADYVVAMRDGKIHLAVSAGDFFDDPSWLAKTGGPREPIIDFRNRLRNSGLVLNRPSLDPVYIADSLRRLVPGIGNFLDK